jgi:hypothetical protein
MNFAALVRRVQAFLLLAIVLSVPALTRASQHVTCVSQGHETSGYSTSADSAPERVTVSPELHVIAPVSYVIVAPQPSVLLVRPSDERLPSPPLITAARPLRAPPSTVFIS